MEPNPSRAEAERLLGIAEKLLQAKDFNGCRDFAVLAQETDPLLDGPDQILAVADVLIASQKRINGHHDYYSLLQIDHNRHNRHDLDLVKKHYRRLAFLLHPDKNRFPFSDAAFRLAAEAWAVLSDAVKKLSFDNELNFYSKVELVPAANNATGTTTHTATPSSSSAAALAAQQQQNKLPVRRSSPWASAGGRAPAPERGGSSSAGGGGGSNSKNNNNSTTDNSNSNNFWTACPYCYNLYEYPRVFVDCCLRCQNCDRAFHAASISELPPIVPGKEAYHCCWGFFPMGFTVVNGVEGVDGGKAKAVPNWTPAPAAAAPAPAPAPAPPPPPAPAAPVVPEVFVGATTTPAVGAKKRGRPRKNLV